jgi:BlaI family penicillinase repressor
MEALGHLQLRIMLHIWQHGPSTVHQVRDALNAQVGVNQLAYSTILTVLRNLTKRRFLDRKPEVRQHRFTPLITKADYQRQMVRQMRMELFGGNAERMLACIAGDDGIDALKRSRITEIATGR